VRWLEGAHLPALRHLAVAEYEGSMGEHHIVTALSAPRWSTLQSLEMSFDRAGVDLAALSAALAPALHRLAVRSWPFGDEGCAEEWPQLRIPQLGYCGVLDEQLGPVRLPRLELLTVLHRSGEPAAVLQGFAALRPSTPALSVVELIYCCCGQMTCPVVGCTHPEAVELLAELRAAWPGLELRRFDEEDWTQV
jgi:hypothetical protein